MAESAPPPALPEVFLERVVDYTKWNEADGGDRPPLRLRVYKPVEYAPDRWGCTVESESAGDPGSQRRIEFTGEDSMQALFYALQLAENTAGWRDVPMPPDIFVERILDYTDGDAVRPVTVRVYKPVQHGPEKWGCIVAFDGLRPEGRKAWAELHGVDGAQALFGALRYAGVEIDCHKGRLSWRDSKPWEPVGFADAMDMLR